MLIIGSILLLLANAVTLRREKSILFNRVAILILLYSIILGYDSLYITSLDTGIGVFSGLFHSTSITHSFDIFIYVIGAVILLLTSFYPRRLRTAKLTTQGSGQIKSEEQFHLPEYPLVILFILIGATFLMSSSDLVSMFIAIELQSYGCAPSEACVIERTLIFIVPYLITLVVLLNIISHRMSPRILLITLYVGIAGIKGV